MKESAESKKGKYSSKTNEVLQSVNPTVINSPKYKHLLIIAGSALLVLITSVAFAPSLVTLTNKLSEKIDRNSLSFTAGRTMMEWLGRESPYPLQYVGLTLLAMPLFAWGAYKLWTSCKKPANENIIAKTEEDEGVESQPQSLSSEQVNNVMPTADPSLIEQQKTTTLLQEMVANSKASLKEQQETNTLLQSIVSGLNAFSTLSANLSKLPEQAEMLITLMREHNETHLFAPLSPPKETTSRSSSLSPSMSRKFDGFVEEFEKEKSGSNGPSIN